MTAERRRAAGHDRADDAPLDPSQMSGVRLNVGFAVAAKNVGQFERRPRRHRLFLRRHLQQLRQFIDPQCRSTLFNLFHYAHEYLFAKDSRHSDDFDRGDRCVYAGIARMDCLSIPSLSGDVRESIVDQMPNSVKWTRKERQHYSIALPIAAKPVRG